MKKLAPPLLDLAPPAVPTIPALEVEPGPVSRPMKAWSIDGEPRPEPRRRQRRQGAPARAQSPSTPPAPPSAMSLADETIEGIRAAGFMPMCEAIARHFSVTVAQIAGPRRTGTVATARTAVMYAIRKYRLWSYPEIGNLFGGRDHTTIMSSLNHFSPHVAAAVDPVVLPFMQRHGEAEDSSGAGRGVMVAGPAVMQ